MSVSSWLARLLAGLRREEELPDPPVIPITRARRQTTVVKQIPIHFTEPGDPPLPEEKDKTDPGPAA